MASKKDLDRGYSETGVIPEEFDNVQNPQPKEYFYMEEETFGKEGFMDRGEYCGLKRY